MPLTVTEARQLGQAKLNIDTGLFDRSLQAAKDMDARPQDLGPLTLALALMGVAKAVDPEDLTGELTDALKLVSQAETEWELERQLEGRQ
jgi:hypothetical protein